MGAGRQRGDLGSHRRLEGWSRHPLMDGSPKVEKAALGTSVRDAHGRTKQAAAGPSIRGSGKQVGLEKAASEQVGAVSPGPWKNCTVRGKKSNQALSTPLFTEQAGGGRRPQAGDRERAARNVEKLPSTEAGERAPAKERAANCGQHQGEVCRMRMKADSAVGSQAVSCVTEASAGWGTDHSGLHSESDGDPHSGSSGLLGQPFHHG